MTLAGFLTMLFAVGSIYGGLVAMLYLALSRKSATEEE